MVSVCTVPARGGRSWERFSGYKTINRIPLPLLECLILIILPYLLTVRNKWSDICRVPVTIFVMYGFVSLEYSQ